MRQIAPVAPLQPRAEIDVERDDQQPQHDRRGDGDTCAPGRWAEDEHGDQRAHRDHRGDEVARRQVVGPEERQHDRDEHPAARD